MWSYTINKKIKSYKFFPIGCSYDKQFDFVLLKKI